MKWKGMKMKWNVNSTEMKWNGSEIWIKNEIEMKMKLKSMECN
jgi:hypothetical protein